MNHKFKLTLKIVAILLIAPLVFILLVVNKYSASVVLVITAVVIMFPSSKFKWKWQKPTIIVALISLVLFNISTTELPHGSYESGFWYFDKVIHIFRGFLRIAFGIE